MKISNDNESFACAHCGNGLVVSRSRGIITLKPIVDEIKKVIIGLDTITYEVAIIRINNEIKELETQKKNLFQVKL